MHRKPQTKTIVLGAIAVLLILLVIRRYIPAIQLPTSERLHQEEQLLRSRQEDLKVQQKTSQNYLEKQAVLRQKAEKFWRRQKPSIPVEQEIADEFRELQRQAGINIVRQSAKLVHSPNSTYLQEVEIDLQMTGASMQEFSRLLQQVEEHPRVFYWSYCRIDPDNPNTPTSIRVNARIKAYVLTEEAIRILNGNFAVPDTSSYAKNASRRSRKSLKRANPAGKNGDMP